MIKNILIVIICFFILVGCSTNRVSQKDAQFWTTTPVKAASIHDPSVFVDSQNNEPIYYVFGSHISQAKSKDLINWEVPQGDNGYVDMGQNIIFDNTIEQLDEIFSWAGYDDADSASGFNLWAPDVIYNPEFIWKDGSEGAYMYYFSASSTWRRSGIGFMVAPNIEGPYTYVGTAVISGFTDKDSTDGSERNTNYRNTIVNKLIKEKKVNGFSDNWVCHNGMEYNTDYAPNAIDPAFIEDKENKLWMVYGSWSGGIFILEIDKKTGYPIYPKNDGQTEDGRIIDRYFGIKIAGGYHQSGEGPYIVYNESTDSYYLYITYGGLSANGGYNMRLFKSKDVTGPYVDAKGNIPIYEQNDNNNNYGIKVMGNYKLEGMDFGYKASGHNSVIMDGDMFLVFHTRFLNRGEQHELKVHQMLMNIDGWPVPLPYEYKIKNSISNIKSEMATGEYEVVNNGLDTSGKMRQNQLIRLNEDGSISGDLDGTWQLNGEKDITLNIEKVTYKGIIVNQQVTTDKKYTVFSLIGDNNETIFGSRELE